MKLTELMEGKKPTAASYNKMLIDALKGMGFKQTEREKTSGAIKTWMETSGKMDCKNIATKLKKIFKKAEYEAPSFSGDAHSIRGDGWKIEKQGDKSIFVAVHAGPKADEYAAGMDV